MTLRVKFWTGWWEYSTVRESKTPVIRRQSVEEWGVGTGMGWLFTATSTFRPIPLLRHRQRIAVNQQAAVRKGLPVPRPGHRRPLHRQGEAGQALLSVDRHAVLGHAAVHDADESMGLALIGGDEHEVVDQA